MDFAGLLLVFVVVGVVFYLVTKNDNERKNSNGVSGDHSDDATTRSKD